MPAQQLSKCGELIGILWNYIDNDTHLDRATIAQIEKDIRLLAVAERPYVTAWLKVAQKKHEDAVAWFKDALRSDDTVVATNYLAYLGASAHNYEHRLELFRLEEAFCTPTIRRVSRIAAFCIGNEKLVRKYTLRMAALLDGEEREQIISEGEFMVERIGDFKRATNLSSTEIEQLCDDAEAIANKYGVNCIGVNYYLSSDDENAFILRAQTQDAQVLADMNMELIGLLCKEEYVGRPFTSWFQSEAKGSFGK